MAAMIDDIMSAVKKRIEDSNSCPYMTPPIHLADEPKKILRIHKRQLHIIEV